MPTLGKRLSDTIRQLHEDRTDKLLRNITALMVRLICGTCACDCMLEEKVAEFLGTPEGQARLRVQMSAAHTAAQISRSLDAFEKLRAL